MWTFDYRLGQAASSNSFGFLVCTLSRTNRENYLKRLGGSESIHRNGQDIRMTDIQRNGAGWRDNRLPNLVRRNPHDPDLTVRRTMASF